jgi:hypothetical protein
VVRATDPHGRILCFLDHKYIMFHYINAFITLTVVKLIITKSNYEEKLCDCCMLKKSVF